MSGVPDIQLVPEADSTDLRYTIRGHDRDRVSPECDIAWVGAVGPSCVINQSTKGISYSRDEKLYL